MNEHFTITIPNQRIIPYYFPNASIFFVAILIAILIVYPVNGLSSIPSILSVIILFVLFYVILKSMTNDNLSNELSNTIYPSLPHLGLDGISLNNYIAGTNASV